MICNNLFFTSNYDSSLNHLTFRLLIIIMLIKQASRCWILHLEEECKLNPICYLLPRATKYIVSNTHWVYQICTRIYVLGTVELLHLSGVHLDHHSHCIPSAGTRDTVSINTWNIHEQVEKCQKGAATQSVKHNDLLVQTWWWCHSARLGNNIQWFLPFCSSSEIFIEYLKEWTKMVCVVTVDSVLACVSFLSE